MRHSTLTIFSTYLLLAPLQWSLSGVKYAFLSRLTWNAPALLLSIVLLLFYSQLLIFGKNKLNKNSVLISLILSGVMIFKGFFIDMNNVASTETTRLLFVILFIPFITYLLDKYGQRIVTSLVISVLVLHSIWGISQFVVQRDLNLYHIGESRLNINLAGVAKFGNEAGKLIRAYGPYSHANSFGGAISIGLACLLLLPNSFPKQVLYSTSTILIMGIILSFSRSAWISMAIIIIIYAWRRHYQTKFWRMACFTALILLVFTPLILDRLTDPEDQGITQRIFSAPTALSIIRSHPLWGVGIGGYRQELETYLRLNHISYQSWEIMPIHSVPLLFLSEWGLLGAVIAFGVITLYIFCTQTFHTKNVLSFTLKNAIILLPLIPLALFDHYLLTQTAPAIWLLTFVCLSVKATKSVPEEVLYV